MIAAVAGNAGYEIADATPELADYHEAACAAAGQWWAVTALLQIGVAGMWALATLEWARLRRRAQRRQRRQEHEEQAEDAGG